VPIIRRNNCVYATLDTRYSVWITVWYAICTLHNRQSSTQNNEYQVSHKHSCFSWRWAHSRPKHVQIDKYTKNNTKLALFTKLTCIAFLYWENIFDENVYIRRRSACITCLCNLTKFNLPVFSTGEVYFVPFVNISRSVHINHNICRCTSWRIMTAKSNKIFSGWHLGLLYLVWWFST
jgi:hypothetical protein